MPFDEAEADDPMSLNGVAFEATPEVAIDAAYAYAEEFARADYTAAHILQVFQSPHYRGPYSAFQILGFQKISEIIGECNAAMAACRAASRSFRDGACGAEVADNVCPVPGR